MLKKLRPSRLMKTCFALFLTLLLFQESSFGQLFTPITVSGFNHDVIAEAGTSSLTTTTIPLDGVTVSNKVMYSVAFRTANGFTGGGIADNGIVTDASIQTVDST